jgi:hypothetical protein
MSDLAEFGKIIRQVIALRGEITFTDRNQQRSRIVFADVIGKRLFLGKTFYVNGETVWWAYWGRGKERLKIFQEASGGPGIYGTDTTEEYYNVTVVNKILPRLRELTVLDAMASIE